MGWEAYLTLGVVVLIFIGLAKEIAPDALLLGGAVVLTLVGIINPKEALAAFPMKA